MTTYYISYLNKSGERVLLNPEMWRYRTEEGAQDKLKRVLAYNSERKIAKSFGLQAVGSLQVTRRVPNLRPFASTDYSATWTP